MLESERMKVIDGFEFRHWEMGGQMRSDKRMEGEARIRSEKVDETVIG